METQQPLSQEKFRKARRIVFALLLGWLLLLGAAISFDLGLWTTLATAFLGMFIADFWNLRLILGSYERFLRLAPAREAALAKRRSNSKTSRQAIKEWSWITKGLVIFFFGGSAALIIGFSLWTAHWFFALAMLPLVAVATYVGWASIR